jgi:hypothetical protein
MKDVTMLVISRPTAIQAGISGGSSAESQSGIGDPIHERTKARHSMHHRAGARDCGTTKPLRLR